MDSTQIEGLGLYQYDRDIYSSIMAAGSRTREGLLSEVLERTGDDHKGDGYRTLVHRLRKGELAAMVAEWETGARENERDAAEFNALPLRRASVDLRARRQEKIRSAGAVETCGQAWVAEIELCPRCGLGSEAHRSIQDGDLMTDERVFECETCGHAYTGSYGSDVEVPGGAEWTCNNCQTSARSKVLPAERATTDYYGPAEDHGAYAHAFGFGVLAAAVDQVLERNTLSTRSAEQLRAALAYSRACLVASGYEG